MFSHRGFGSATVSPPSPGLVLAASVWPLFKGHFTTKSRPRHRVARPRGYHRPALPVCHFGTQPLPRVQCQSAIACLRPPILIARDRDAISAHVAVLGEPSRPLLLLHSNPAKRSACHGANSELQTLPQGLKMLWAQGELLRAHSGEAGSDARPG